jgi:hypothetical protein
VRDIVLEFELSGKQPLSLGRERGCPSEKLLQRLARPIREQRDAGREP